MGNVKNKRTAEITLIGMFTKKRKLPEHCNMDTEEQHTETDNDVEERIEGSRIINLDKLQQYTEELTKHSA